MEWLQQIFDRILALIPGLVMVDPTEMAARITGGSQYRVLKPGWYIVWPVLQKVIAMEVVTQVVDLPPQSVRTSDGQDIVVSGAVRYRIRDVEKALFTVQDVDQAIVTLALGVILEYVRLQKLSDCDSIDGVKQELRKKLADAARGWGVKVEQVYLTDLGRVRSLRLFGDMKGIV
ncbi:MAG: SPFH domain-containing protein [Chloroflexi bacterium]|nr:SPFH domain-containing protein [Chloroflexota bacterium]